MIKNLKYRLFDFITSRRVRIGGLALLLALTVSAATLLGCPIHTIDILTGQKLFTLNKTITPNAGVTVAVAEDVTYPVYITCGLAINVVEFKEGTVADALALAGFTPDSDDFVEPSLETVINDTIYIDYARVNYESGTYTEAVAFETKIVYSDQYNKGYRVLSQKGVNGTQEVSYTEKFVNGDSSEKTVTGTKLLANPQTQITIIGTKEKTVKTSADVKSVSTLTPGFTIELDANGNPVNYKSKKTVRATAYTYTGNNCSTGVAPQPGYIAVNPKVIPYGTKMYIKSADGRIIYGYAVAADTGGFIRNYPHGVDLFYPSEAACRNFGVRSMEIYILN